MKKEVKYERDTYRMSIDFPIFLCIGLVTGMIWITAVGFYNLSHLMIYYYWAIGATITLGIFIVVIYFYNIKTNNKWIIEDNEAFNAFKPYRITVKNKQCCGGLSEIYTEEFPDMIFNVSRIDYFNMHIGKKYLIYSSIIDNHPTQTQLSEEL